ncbi:MAG TPA: putative Na+/H+ antiporter, partial [Opitutaceae bacterium]|nr:putative Na+/H+ antiporter [Opitutaceae bacterium]
MSWALFHLAAAEFPLPLDRYPPLADAGLAHTLANRVRIDPFNLVATAIFFLAVLHTFLTPYFRRWAHRVEARHQAHSKSRRATHYDEAGNEVPEVSFAGQILHFLGEVEAVFGV